MATTSVLPGSVSPVDLDTSVATVARPATTLAETTPLPEAWFRVNENHDRCGVVVRNGLPIAVVTAGGLAERWPGGGPLAQHRGTVHDVLDRPCGVEVLDGHDTVRHAGHRLLATGLPALPVRAQGGGPLQLVTAVAVLRTALAGGAPA